MIAGLGKVRGYYWNNAVVVAVVLDVLIPLCIITKSPSVLKRLNEDLIWQRLQNWLHQI